MQCQVRSPDRTLFDGEATMVVARSSTGEFAVMDDHAPLLATLRSGPLRIKTPETERVFACFGGSLRVSDAAEVTVLVEEAIPVEEIALSEAMAALEASDEAMRARLAVLQEVKETYG